MQSTHDSHARNGATTMRSVRIAVRGIVWACTVTVVLLAPAISMARIHASKRGQCNIQRHFNEQVAHFGERCVKRSALRQIDAPLMSVTIGQVHRNRSDKTPGRNYAKAWKIISRDEYRKPGRRNGD
ncbi:hypothetical protein [Haliangium sp.]|uniref:hypothetical protein n=1 Tax=Haliangium sp. TaxID=2663208 RepID=UPI003D13609A